MVDWTNEQTPIFQAVSAWASGIVNSVAGSGKTSVIVEALRYVPRTKQALLLAFNKHIAAAIKKRKLPHNATATTTHALCMKLCMRQIVPQPRVVKDKTRRILVSLLHPDEEEKLGPWISTICRMVSLLKNIGYGTISELPSRMDYDLVATKYGYQLPDPEDNPWGDQKCFEATRMVLMESISDFSTIDFDDMLVAPILLNLKFDRYHYVFVDESQDLNSLQIELIRRIVGDKNKVFFVGDRNQSIYAFRGASVDAMDSVKEMFGATEYPMTICWRCPLVAIRRAQEVVPHIQPAPNAIEGIERSIPSNKYDFTELPAGAFVLCRVNAPLIGACARTVIRGKKAYMRGTDVGKQLSNLTKQVEKARRGFGDSLSIRQRLKLFKDKLHARLVKKRLENTSTGIAALDRIDTLLELEQVMSQKFGSRLTWALMRERIDGMFSDDDDPDAIMFSSVHKAKGLESKHVTILRPDLMPHPAAKGEDETQQELNIYYVAVTRTQHTLDWILPPDNDPDETEAEEDKDADAFDYTEQDDMLTQVSSIMNADDEDCQLAPWEDDVDFKRKDYNRDADRERDRGDDHLFN